MAIGDAVPFGKSAEAHDADTVYEGGQGFRLYGIDSQEVSRKGVQKRDQPAPSSEADKATKYLADIMANEQVSYEDMGEDAYGRRVVRLRGEDGRDINEELVREAGAGLMSFGNETSPYTGARAEYQNKIFSGQERVEPGRVFHEEDYAPTRSVTQELGTGFERGSKMLGAMVGKAVEVLGDTTGVDAVSAKGREVAQKYLMEAAVPSLRPQVDTYKDVEDFRSGMNYVAGILGEQAPQLAADASAAAVGALTGAGVGAIPAVAARRGAMSAALRMVAGESAAQGAKRGAMASMFAQSLGESAMELEAEGIDDRKAAIAAAFAKMGAEYAGTLAMFRTAKRMAFDGNKVTSRVMMHEAAKSIGWEGGTEGLQTIIDKAAVAYHKDGYDILSDDNMEEIVNSMIAGAVVGGTVSGVSGGGRMAIDRLLGGEQKAPAATEETAPVEEAAPVVEEAPAAPSFEEPAPAVEETPAAPVSEGYAPGTFDVSQLAFGQDELPVTQPAVDRAQVEHERLRDMPQFERPVVAEAAVAAKAAEEPVAERPVVAEAAVAAEVAPLAAEEDTSVRDWDAANRTQRSTEWIVGAAEANPAFEASVGGEAVAAHGMAKASTLGEAVSSLKAMLSAGFDPSRTLYYDRLTTGRQRGAGAASGTAGGHAYRDGPFIVVFKDGLDGRQPTRDDVSSVLVNPANAAVIPGLQKQFPHVNFREYGDVQGAIDEVKNTSSMSANNQSAEFIPRSEVHKRFQQGVDKLARGEESVDAALGVARTETEVADEKPVTAQASADSVRQDPFDDSVRFGASVEGEFSEISGEALDLEGDTVTASENAKKRTIADAIAKGMAVAENMQQVYRLSRYKDDDVETGVADVADMRAFEREKGVGSARKMNAKFIPTDSYMKRRSVRVRPAGSDEWFRVDFRTLLEEVYNSRDIDTTEKDPLPHKRVLNQISYVLGELADNGIEIQAYDADGRPSEQAIDPENTIVWTPAKEVRDVYQGSNGNELTIADIHAHEMAANSTDYKQRNRYAKLNPTTIVDYEDSLAENIDLLQDAIEDARENPKDPDVIPYLRRSIRRVGGVADGKDIGTLLREAEYAHAQGKKHLAKIRREASLEVGGDTEGDASDVYDGLALDAISKKQNGRDFFAEVSVSTKRGPKKEDSGATQPKPDAKEAPGVSFSLRSPSEISGAARNAITSLIEASGLKSKVVITTDVSADTRARGVPASIRFENGQAIIELNMAEIRDMDANKQDVVTTLVAHELGHAWMQEKGLRIPEPVLADLHEAYRKARAAAPAGHVYRKQKGVGFDEWFADQFMTYALRKSRATASPTQKYFARVWKGVSKVINTLGKALFGADRFAESETGLAFVSSVFRTAVNDKPLTANKFDRMLADAYEELFGNEAATRVGAGERRATTEARAVGDAATINRVASLEKRIAARKESIGRARLATEKNIDGSKSAISRIEDSSRPASVKNAMISEQKQIIADLQVAQRSKEDAAYAAIAKDEEALTKISATEPRDFYARAFFQQYGGVQGAQRIFQGAVRHAKEAATLVSPIWATSIRRLKQLGHHTLGASYEKYFTDVTAEMRLWMAQLDRVSDADLNALANGVRTAAIGEFYDKFFKYLKRDGGMPTLGKISNNYVHRMFDRTAIEADQAGFRRYLQNEAMANTGYLLSTDEANGIIKTLLKDDSAYYQLDASGGASFAGNAAARSLSFLNDLSLQSTQWVIQDKRVMMAGYVHSMLKRATYEKHFGGYHEVLDTDQKPATLLRYHMQNIPFRARDLGITTGEERRMATDFEKKRFFEKEATTRQILDLAASASARGWVKIEAQPSSSGQGFSIKYSMYEPSYRQNQILRGYRASGEQDKAKEFVRISDALSGRLGQDAMSPTARKLSGIIMTYENILTLLFASLSSFPDLVGPIVRSRDFAGVRDALAGMVEVMGNTTDARERRKLLHDFGFAHRTTTEQALLEVFGAQFMSGTAQKVNDAFFKYTGLEAVTAFGRTMSASVAMRFIQRHAAAALAGNAESVRYLRELGLTPDEANSLNGAFKTLPQMLADGTAFDASGVYTAEAQTADKVLTALNQFVDESVVRPDSTQRPVWASDPRFMLVWHLKSFAYSYAKVIIKPVFKEAMYQYQKHGISPKVAVPLLTFALPVMLASALGLRLRELVQYDIPHEMGLKELDRPSAEREFDEYLYDVIRRGGILGPAELAVNAMEAEDKKRSALVTLLGPTADHLNALLQFDAYKAATRSVPVLSQMPEFKMWMYDEMH